MKTVPFFPLIVLLVLAGCMGTFMEESPACLTSHPMVRGGSTFVYNTTGSLLSLTFDRPVVEGHDFSNDELTGQMAIVTDARLHARVSLAGNLLDSLIATYWFRQNDSSPWVAIAEEAVSPETGTLVQSVYRNIVENDQGSLHQSRLTRWGRPPLLLGTAISSVSESGMKSFPFEQFQVNDQPGLGQMSWEITTIKGTEGSCETSIYFEMDQRPSLGFRGPAIAEASFDSQIPLPKRFDLIWQAPQRDVKFTAILSTWKSGEGPTVIGWDPAPEPGHLDMATRSSLLAGDFEAFPTSFEEARQAVLDDLDDGQWLRDNPDAMIVTARHVVGAEDSRTVDQWMIEWATQESGRKFIVQRLNEDTPIKLFEYEIFSMTIPGLYVENHSSSVKASALENLVERLYGEPMQVLSCDFLIPHCLAGTHGATGMPRASGMDSNLLIVPGIMVDPFTGLVYREDSYSDEPLGTPADPPSIR